MDGTAEFFERTGDGWGCCMEYFIFFGKFSVFLPLLVRVLGGGVWEMLVGKDGWRKGLY